MSEDTNITVHLCGSREQWLKERKSYIGGSEAASVVGMSPYKTNVQLWEEKTGRYIPEEIRDNPFVEYGSKAEEYLRELFKLDFPRYEVDYEPFAMWTNKLYPYAHASLDGWLIDPYGQFGVLEIKTATISTGIQAEKWRGKIPDNYYCQILHYMLVTEAAFACLKAQLKYDREDGVKLVTKHYWFERADLLEDIIYLEERERQFAEYIRKDMRPPLVLPTL